MLSGGGGGGEGLSSALKVLFLLPLLFSKEDKSLDAWMHFFYIFSGLSEKNKI
jgi:hypothetical protein